MKSCTVQIFTNQQWRDAASLTVPSAEGGAASALTVSYDLAYGLTNAGRSDGAAMAFNQPVTLEPIRYSQWPAYLIDHLPQGFGRLELLRQLGLPERSEASADWALLTHGAGCPIGHLRIKEAHAYITERSATNARAPTWADKKGFTFDEVASRGEGFTEYLASHGLFVAGSSGVQGEWPKILLTEDAHGHLHLDHDLPDHLARRHWLVKFARGTDAALAKILRLEATWMALAKHLGLRTCWEQSKDGKDSRDDRTGIVHLYKRALFIERFDRAVIANPDAQVLRHPQESLYSLCQVGGFSGNLTHNEAIGALAKAAADPAAEVLEYLKRDIANVVLGNKDNHGRNTAVTRAERGVVLTPVFDFCPMYLHPDGIARRMRWADADGRLDTGQPNWQLALAHTTQTLEGVGASAAELQGLGQGIQRMGARLDTLLPEMKALGVDRDVIQFLRPIIETNTRLLCG